MIHLSGRFAAALARVASMVRGPHTCVAMGPSSLSVVSPGVQVHVYQAHDANADMRELPEGWLGKAAKLAGRGGVVSLMCGPRERGLGAIATGSEKSENLRLHAQCRPHDVRRWLAPNASTRRSAATSAAAFAPGGAVARALTCAGKDARMGGVWLGDFVEATEGHRLAHEPAPDLAPLAGVWLPVDVAKTILALVAAEPVTRLDWRWCDEWLVCQLHGSDSHIYICADVRSNASWKPGKAGTFQGDVTLAMQVNVDALLSLLHPLRADGRLCIYSDGAIVAWDGGGAATEHEGPTVGAPLWSAALKQLLPVLTAAKRAQLRTLDVKIGAPLALATWGAAAVMPLSNGDKEAPTVQWAPHDVLREIGLSPMPAAAAAAAAAAAQVAAQVAA